MHWKEIDVFNCDRGHPELSLLDYMLCILSIFYDVSAICGPYQQSLIELIKEL